LLDLAIGEMQHARKWPAHRRHIVGEERKTDR
jgi:hypothetical protein